ncbi:UNVERIFIED_CONTAM: hypothetical protein RMT77_017938 [Armadillidium vulgare]
MKNFWMLFLLGLTCVSALSTVDLDWEDFKTKYNKEYSPEEDIKRHQIFNENKLMIEEHNKKFEEGEVTFTMAINKFGDMLLEETISLMGLNQRIEMPRGNTDFTIDESISFPISKDWRDFGVVTPVKDQHQCGASWAFSATGALEGQSYKTGKLISLSEQNLIDCIGSDGCIGGYVTDAYRYIQMNKGIDSEESYPYTASDKDRCNYNPQTVGANCTGYVAPISGTEHKLLYATTEIGPMSVCIDANHHSFIFYESGIYYIPNCSRYNPTHCLLVIGYAKDAYLEFWMLKNSWGVKWGENGYIKMARNKDNLCGIATHFSYPLV